MFNQRCWYVYTQSPVVSAWGWISGYIEPCDTWFKVFVVQYCFKVEFCILNMYSVVYILLHCHFPKPLQIQENSSTTSHSLEYTKKLHHHTQVNKTRKNPRKCRRFWLYNKWQGYENFGRFNYIHIYYCLVLH